LISECIDAIRVEANKASLLLKELRDESS